MADINNVTVSGRLVRDVETKEVGSSTLVTGSIAVNRSVKKGDKYETEASYFDFKLWCKSEKQLNFYRSALSKGAVVALSGFLVQERWETDGKKNSRVVIMVNDIASTGKSTGSSEGSSSDVPSGSDSGFPEDIPF